MQRETMKKQKKTEPNSAHYRAYTKKKLYNINTFYYIIHITLL